MTLSQGVSGSIAWILVRSNTVVHGFLQCIWLQPKFKYKYKQPGLKAIGCLKPQVCPFGKWLPLFLEPHTFKMLPPCPSSL